jgi:hypothetical protein
MKTPAPEDRLDEPISKPLFFAEVDSWARELGVVPRLVQVRRMTREWGSSSAAGQVTFNSDVLWMPPAFRRQVIIGELERLKAVIEARAGDQTAVSEA